MASDAMMDEGTQGTGVPPAAGGSRDAAEFSRRVKAAVLGLLIILFAALALAAYLSRPGGGVASKSGAAAFKVTAPPEYLFSIAGSVRHALRKPIGVAVGRNNRVYVVDGSTRSVKVFSTRGRYLFEFNAIRDLSFAAIRTGVNKTLRAPVYVAVDKDDNVWVTDRGLSAVLIFDADGNFLRTFHAQGDIDFEMSPLGISVDDEEDVYLTDLASVETHRILVLDADGGKKAVFGEGGQVTDTMASPGSFYFPNGVVASPSSVRPRHIYVADSNNGRVQVFDMTGGGARIIPSGGTPRGIVVDAEGRVLVADVMSHQVDMYSPNGQRLATFGEYGIGPGKFRYPEGIALDDAGRIYVTDRENGRVQVWAFGKTTAGGVRRTAIVAIGQQWPWCLVLIPLLLLPLLVAVLLSRRVFVATEDFVDGMIATESVGRMAERKWRWLVTDPTHEKFVGRVVDGVDLGTLLEPVPYSFSDASPIADQLGVPIETAGILSLAQRYKALCTEDPELTQLSRSLGVDVYDRVSFAERFLQRGGR